jgi:peptide/nickel transport system ATP-binding protein
MTALVEVRDLAKVFDVSLPWLNRVVERKPRQYVHAVDGVSFAIRRGRTLALVGESGCGKSTVARLLVGLYVPTRGSVSYDGVDAAATLRSPNGRALRKRMQMIFQDPYASLNPRWRVREIVAEPLREHGLAATEAELSAHVAELLSSVGLAAADMGKFPHQFSGGMRQRVVIALALAAEPKLIVADEPTTALDVSIQAQIIALLKRLVREHGAAVMLVTHDMGVIAETCDRVAVMYAGRIVEQAPIETLFDRPEHPYTEALLGSLPKIDNHDPRNDRLATIPGRPPDLLMPPEACRFAPRCKYAGTDDCNKVQPELREIRTGHWVRTQHPASERAAEPVGAR